MKASDTPVDRVVVTDAQPRHAQTIADFNAAMARETEGRELDALRLRRGVRAVFDSPEHGFYLVAKHGEAGVVGCLLLTREWSDWRNGEFWWIQSVYVAPEFRGRGIFRALYAEVVARAREIKDVCGLRLYVERDNGGAQSVYRRLGMEDTGYRVFEQML